MAEMIGALASMLWPLLALVALLVFRAPLSRLIRSAESREWTIEVGGQTITVKQLSDQQNALIADLQEQVGALRKTVAGLTPAPAAWPDTPWHTAPLPPSGDHPDAPTGGDPVPASDGDPDPPSAAPAPTGPNGGAPARPRMCSVLWVDDNPQNNALLIEQLQRHGLLVDLAISTQAGLQLLGQRRYGMVISDMVRHENGAAVLDAGIRLLRAVRQLDRDIPFVLYCNPHARDLNNDLALAEGANAITSSGAALLEQMRAAELL